MLTGNKGEWSEIYALFKVLGDKELQPGDKDLNKIKDLVYPVLKVLRCESGHNFEYGIEDDFVIVSGDEEVLRISVDDFKSNAQVLLRQIKSSNGTFSIPEIEEFMKTINCLSLKASSSVKTDITIVIHDQRTGLQPTLGFSIKSQLGGASTLLNAGKTTNFIFKISDLTLSKEQIDEINAKPKIKERIDEITTLKGKLVFSKVESSIFENNMVLIDSSLPELIAECTYLYYTSSKSTISDIISEIAEINPLSYNTETGHPFYSYKMKHFLTDIALGMMPSKVWTGQLDATGGYLVIKEDGDVLCYHIYNRNEFEDYLLNNTKFETASTSRHEFGTIYKEGDDLFINLNLQIRFIK
ncbi:HpaII family restriction endonuclease [Bacteroides sp. 214]|uniref:HpaII family restriction endonuclease n=1 Tax=Bacteroides sp. 214 TaxID=2302935 RepID=UPI0013D53333|nr:HpaII family restriction endonuclease [Bacteroides sp. 214]NDW11828.1 HpaII family restriction endonuclease [Bacteroides sp. 214]